MTDIIIHSTSPQDAVALELSHPEKFRRAFCDLLSAAKAQSLDPSSFLATDHASARAFLKALDKEKFWRTKGDFEILEISLDFAGTIESVDAQFDAFLATFSANTNRNWIVVVPLASTAGGFGAVKPIQRTWKMANGWNIMPPLKSPRGFVARMSQHVSGTKIGERLVEHQALVTGYQLANDAALTFQVTGTLRSAGIEGRTRFSYFRWLSDALRRQTTYGLSGLWAAMSL